MTDYQAARKRVEAAVQAHDRVLSNHVATGSTQADRRFSDGEALDSAREAMFDELASLTIEDLRLLLAGPPEPSVRGDKLREVHTFLLGEGTLMGRMFGDEPPTLNGRKLPYWWRTKLREAIYRSKTND